MKAWKAFEVKLQDYLDHAHALVIHRMLSASLQRQRHRERIAACALIKARMRARPSRGRYVAIAAAALRLSGSLRRIAPAEYHTRVAAARILSCAVKRAALDGKYNRTRSAVRLQMTWQCCLARRRARAVRRAGSILGASAARCLAIRMLDEVYAYAKRGASASPARARSSAPAVTRRFAFWRGSTTAMASPPSPSSASSFRSGFDQGTQQGAAPALFGDQVFGVPVAWVDFLGGRTGEGAAILHAVRMWTPNRDGSARGPGRIVSGGEKPSWGGGMWFLVEIQSIIRGFLARSRVRKALAASRLASSARANLFRAGYSRFVAAILLQVKDDKILAPVHQWSIRHLRQAG